MRDLRALLRSLISLLIFAGGISTAHAQSLYWDTNEIIPGAASGDIADGIWDAGTPNWTTDPDGDSITQSWVQAAHAIFSAGTDALDSIITVSGPRTVSSLTIEEGRVEFVGPGGSIAIGANPARVNQGATLEIRNQSVISTSPGHVLTLNGGTLRNSNPGFAAATYPGMGTQIQLTSNGGTFDIPAGGFGGYNLMSYSGVVGMSPGTTSATLNKTGPGEFRPLTGWTFTGLNVEQGLYRIGNPSGSETGFGAPTGTVTVAGGAVENTTNGAALGTNIGLIDANASPATRSFVLTGAGDTLDSMFMLNAHWTINGPISGPGGLMLNGWARNDGGGMPNIIGSQTQTLTLAGTNTYGGATTINFGRLVVTGGSAITDTSAVIVSTRSAWGGNAGSATTTLNIAEIRVDASETIGSLAGGNASRGVVNINGPAVTLTTGVDDRSTTYSGGIIGTGGLSKDGTGTFAMNGIKSYAGDTTVLAGTLSTNSASFADLSGVYLSSGSLLNLNFVGIDTVDSLFVDGLQRRSGIWGAPGSGAPRTSGLISGSGFLQVTTVPEPPTFMFPVVVCGMLLARRRIHLQRRPLFCRSVPR